MIRDRLLVHCLRALALYVLCAPLALAQSRNDVVTGYTQQVIPAPDSGTRQQVTGLAAIENTAREIVLAGGSRETSDDTPFASSAFLARIDDAGLVLDWSAYGTMLADARSEIRCLETTVDGGLIAGGSIARSGYVLRTGVGGETLWSLTLEAEGIERVVAIEPSREGGFFLYGESNFRTDDPDSGKYSIVLVDDEGVSSVPTRYYGALQQEAFLQVVRVVAGVRHVYSYAFGDPGTPPELWVRGFDVECTFLWERSLGTSPDYPVAGVHLTSDRNGILVRPKLRDGVFDGSCRLEYLDQEGIHYRTRDVIVGIYGTDLVGAIQFTDGRFGIVTYDREAVHVAVCDYQRGFYRRHLVPVDQSLAADVGAAGPAVARPEIHAMALRGNGDLVLAGSLITEAETPADESGGVAELYRVEIEEDTLHLDFSEMIRIATTDLFENFEAADISGDGTLRYDEALALRPSFTLEMFRVVDVDSNNTLSYDEVLNASYYGKPGGVMGCSTREHRVGGDWAMAFAMLAFLALWGRRQAPRYTREKHGY